MNGHFSYELDERQIKLMMQDAELVDDDNVWDKFEGLNAPETKPSIEFKLPKIHISPSVFIPIFFIAIIGILSAMLFSLVDFKKKEKVINETTFKPKIETVQKAIPIKKKPIVIKTVVPVLVDSIPDSTLTATVTESVKVVESPTVSTSKKDTTVYAFANKEKSTPIKIKKKKRRRVVAEDLPIISSPLRLEEKEPDLELK